MDDATAVITCVADPVAEFSGSRPAALCEDDDDIGGAGVEALIDGRSGLDGLPVGLAVRLGGGSDIGPADGLPAVCPDEHAAKNAATVIAASNVAARTGGIRPG